MKSKHIVAIGAHPGDMEISCGAILAAHTAKGDLVTFVHLTGEESNSCEKYTNQFRFETKDAAFIISAKVILCPFQSNHLEYNQDTQGYIINIILQLQPTTIITHWKHSLNHDHIIAHKIVCDSVSQSRVFPENACNQFIYFAENWEDQEKFEPVIYINTTNVMDTWLKMTTCYEMFNRENSSYLNYYQSLAKMRGNESHFQYACTLGINRAKEKQYFDLLP